MSVFPQDLINTILNATEDGILALADGVDLPFVNDTYRSIFPGCEQHRYNEPIEVVREFFSAKLKNADDFCKAVETLRRTQSKSETVIRLNDGRVFQVTGCMVKTGLGESGEAEIWTLRDITQRLADEKKMLAEEQSRICAEQDSITKSMFLANMSHEIRTPVNSVIGFASLLKLTPLSPPQKEYTEQIHDSAKHLLTLINDILDFSAIEAGKLEIAKTETALPELLEDIIGVLLPRAVEKDIDLRYELLSEIPRLVIGDPARIRQVLVHLLGNALKFTLKGSICVSVEDLEPRKTASEFKTVIRFSVTDTGIGIPNSKLSSVLSVFSQADNSTERKTGGTGLGLSVSKELITLMGGSIGVISEEGTGTTFWFTLPFKIPALSKTDVLSSQAGSMASWTSDIEQGIREQCLILVAEDNRIDQIVICEILSQAGYRFEIVENGRLAYESFTKKEYSLILMDCHMPKMDGFEAAKIIRSLETGNRAMPVAGMSSTGSNGGIPIIAIAVKEDEKRCLTAGMDDYCTKPFNAGQVLKTIEKWLYKSLHQQGKV